MPPKEVRRRQSARLRQVLDSDVEDEEKDSAGEKELSERPAARSPTAGASQSAAQADAAGTDANEPQDVLPPRLPGSSLTRPISGSPSLGLSDGRPRAPKYQPKSNIRRSKQERDAQEKAERERQKERAAASAPKRGRGGFARGSFARGRGRGGRGAFRGGLSGWKADSRVEPTGFLGGPSGERKTARGRGARSDGAPTFLGSSKPSNTASTTERMVHSNSEKGQSENANLGKASSTSPKSRRKAGKRVSSGSVKSKEEKDSMTIKDEDDEFLGFGSGNDDKRINIDELIDISSGDERLDEDPLMSAEPRSATPFESSQGRMRPVRTERHEHVERSKGVNTDASSAKSAQLRRKALQQAQDPSQIMEIDHLDPVSRRSKGKGKGKAVQFEKVKDEPPDSDGITRDAAADKGASTVRTVEDEEDEDDEDVVEPKKRQRKRHPVFRQPRPTPQTDEDYAEWERHEKDLQEVAEELGGPAVAIDVDADSSKMNLDEPQKAPTDQEETVLDRKEDLVFLFQLPPFLPGLRVGSDDKKAGNEQDKQGGADDMVPAHTDGDRRSPLPEDVARELADDPIEALDEAPSASGITASSLAAAAATTAPGDEEKDNAKAKDKEKKDSGWKAGRVGTLTVYQGGVSTMMWGGIEYELGKAPLSDMLQEVLVAGEKDTAGYSMGQVAGGFVVTPSWPALFEHQG